MMGVWQSANRHLIRPRSGGTTSGAAAYLGLQVATVSSYQARGQMPEPDLTLWSNACMATLHNHRTRPKAGSRRWHEQRIPPGVTWMKFSAPTLVGDGLRRGRITPGGQAQLIAASALEATGKPATEMASLRPSSQVRRGREGEGRCLGEKLRADAHAAAGSMPALDSGAAPAPRLWAKKPSKAGDNGCTALM